ncbi:MAG: hypothetical protein Q4B64_02690 [Spirochaetales bacterium]|nr:hypothetical protein [Spirochaetales bacterium]
MKNTRPTHSETMVATTTGTAPAAERKSLRFPEEKAFGVAVAIAAAPVVYVVAEKAFPVIVEKGLDLITSILER